MQKRLLEMIVFVLAVPLTTTASPCDPLPAPTGETEEILPSQAGELRQKIAAAPARHMRSRRQILLIPRSADPKTAGQLAILPCVM